MLCLKMSSLEVQCLLTLENRNDVHRRTSSACAACCKGMKLREWVCRCRQWDTQEMKRFLKGWSDRGVKFAYRAWLCSGAESSEQLRLWITPLEVQQARHPKTPDGPFAPTQNSQEKMKQATVSSSQHSYASRASRFLIPGTVMFLAAVGAAPRILLRHHPIPSSQPAATWASLRYTRPLWLL